MLYKYFFVILAFTVLVLLVGCGDNLNPIVSGDSNPQVKIEIQELVAGKEVGEYDVRFIVSITNLGDKEIAINKSSFSMYDMKVSVIYSKNDVFVFDPTSAESSRNLNNDTTFVLKPKSTEAVGLFTVVSTDPIGKWNLVYGNRQIVILVQEGIEAAVANGNKTGEEKSGNGKDSTGNQPADKPSNDGKDSAGNIGNPSNPPPKPKEIIGSDGAPMALIPAGEFKMGSNDDWNVRGNGGVRPVHTVYLDAFYMDQYEVTNAQYRKFVQATGHREPRGWEEDDRPVVFVSWEDAKVYAEWAGKRLPTEAEWEKAARGGLIGKTYPWGDDIDHVQANWVNGVWGIDFWEFLGPVGSFKPNGYGLYDMSGNAWEWCADWYAEDYYAESPYRNPQGPASGSERVTRGGGYDDSYVSVAERQPIDPHEGFSTVGFRCAMDATK